MPLYLKTYFFTVLFRVFFLYATNNFHVVLCSPSHEILATPLDSTTYRWCRQRRRRFEVRVLEDIRALRRPRACFRRRVRARCPCRPAAPSCECQDVVQSPSDRQTDRQHSRPDSNSKWISVAYLGFHLQSINWTKFYLVIVNYICKKIVVMQI